LKGKSNLLRFCLKLLFIFRPKYQSYNREHKNFALYWNKTKKRN